MAADVVTVIAASVIRRDLDERLSWIPGHEVFIRCGRARLPMQGYRLSPGVTLSLHPVTCGSSRLEPLVVCHGAQKRWLKSCFTACSTLAVN